MSCGHLCRRMDTILPVGNTPRIHMVEGLLTSSGCPERCSCFDFAKWAGAEGGSGPCLLLFWPWLGFLLPAPPPPGFPAHQPCSPTPQARLAQETVSSSLGSAAAPLSISRKQGSQEMEHYIERHIGTRIPLRGGRGPLPSSTLTSLLPASYKILHFAGTSYVS